MSSANRIHLLSAEDCAILLVYNIREYLKERNKDTSRIFMTNKTVRTICNRSRMTDGFLNDVYAHVDLYAWAMYPCEDGFIFLRHAWIKSATMIGSKRIIETLQQADTGSEQAFQRLMCELGKKIEMTEEDEVERQDLN